MAMHKSYIAAAMYLMSAGFGCAGESMFKRGVESVVVVKSSSGYWLVKSL